VPGKSTEWHAVKLLLQPGNKSLRGELLKLQQPDGGWGWRTGEPSDAFGTGLALYALARSGLPASDGDVRRAITFLQTTQRPDGAWPVPSTRARDKNKVNATASYWGTAWAVIGLLESQMPPTSVPAG
jgi:squalene-hopene/tetraprenyl-beta-curcumene cyclase